MLVNNIRRTVTDDERDQVIAKFARDLASNGPFRELKFVPADLQRSPADVLATAGLDTAYTTRLIVLDPAQYSLRNGMEEQTIEALTMAAGLGQGTQQLPVQWASSAVFAVVNTQKRVLARGIAVEFLAKQRALAAPEVQNDNELKETGASELDTARDRFTKAVKQAYRHVVYVVQPDPDGERYLDQLTFDGESETALDGTLVWKGLAERDKTFGQEKFGAKALLHNLRDQDYGRTLSDVRAAFYSAPRLPLLYSGDSDLQRAIHDAVSQGLLRIVDGAGTEVAVTTPGQVNLLSAGLRLARPQPQVCPVCSQPAHEGGCPAVVGIADRGDAHGAGTGFGSQVGFGSQAVEAATGGADAPLAVSTERQVSFSFTSNLLASSENADKLAALFRAFYIALDERQISYLQGTIQLMLQEGAAEQIQRQLADLGIRATSREI